MQFDTLCDQFYPLGTIASSSNDISFTACMDLCSTSLPCIAVSYIVNGGSLCALISFNTGSAVVFPGYNAALKRPPASSSTMRTATVTETLTAP
jgi:hypothetical protein